MKRARFAALGAALLAASLPLTRGDDAPSTEIPKGVSADSLGKFKITYYWVTCEDDAKGERDTELLDKQGKSLGKFRADFAKNIKIEGTGRTLEGKTLNYAGVVKGESRYHYIKQPWGTGWKDQALEPFRSLAVDVKVIAQGTKIFIPQAVGALLPDGSVHDGVFVAADTGGGIKSKHIDIFCGLKRDMKILAKRGIDDENVELFKLAKDERKPPKPVAFPREGAVRFTKVAVHEQPDLDAATKETLEGGKKVKVLAKEGGFWKLGDGRFIEGPALDLR